MSDPAIRPYGSWRSPISATSIVRSAARISEVKADPVRPGLLWWSESRPDEGGRTAVMCCDVNPAGTGIGAGIECDISSSIVDASASRSVGDAGAFTAFEVTPPSANVRTKVHEYGGGAWWPHDGVLYYVEFADQRLRRLGLGNNEPFRNDEPVLLTPESSEPGALRYADGQVSKDGRWCICVLERHCTGQSEPTNELIAVATDGSQQVELLWSGADFVMAPRISSDGTRLAWIAWDHPNMPWDATRLHVHEYNGCELGAEILVVGSDGDRSLCEPGWVPSDGSRADGSCADDRLLVCSDHEDWWGLYEVSMNEGTLIAKITGRFDIATPPWVFGMQRWSGNGTTLIAATGLATGDELLVSNDDLRSSGFVSVSADSSITSLTMLDVGTSGGDDVSDVADVGGTVTVAYAGAGYEHETEVVVLTITDFTAHTDLTAQRKVIRPARKLGLNSGFLVIPEAITFPTVPYTNGVDGEAFGVDGEAFAHAIYYPPANPDCVAPTGERPPLLVLAHGGPTASARSELNLDILYWTSRGIAVVDVNYRGSTGYGRQYRRALNGAWGIVDVHDCVAAAHFLVERGDVDSERLLIRGSSAGGFTALAALAFYDVFAAGASRYGVTDLELLAADTHKFESRYLDTLVGPWPEARDIYAQRSPIRHLDSFNTPIIVLQGAADEIVPPNQAEMIVKALEEKGVDVAYVLFEHEHHGFRLAENIVTALESELAFFAAVLGFSTGDDIAPIKMRGKFLNTSSSSS